MARVFSKQACSDLTLLDEILLLSEPFHADDIRIFYQLAATSLQASFFVTDCLELSFNRIKGIADGNVDIFMGMIVMLVMVNDDVVIGNRGFYAYVVYLAFIMMVMRGLNNHSETLNLVAESL